MLTLVTGVPGACKTAYTVDQLDKLEKQNFINVHKNKVVFEFNKPLFEKFKDEFSFIIQEVGSGYDLKYVTVPLAEDYFSFLIEEHDELRPDYYFQRSVHYNEIIERINESYGQQKFELLRPVRTIYSNISALKIPFARSLIRDWRDAPDGSVFAIDEIQNLEPYSDKKSQDKVISDLTIHRHRGFDFYIITQFPNLLHPTIKALIGLHYHLTKPWGWTTRIYQYGTCRDNPNALVNKFNYEAKFKYKPQDRLFKLYKSTTINTHKKRTPNFIFFIGGFVILMIILFFFFANKAKNSQMAERISQTDEQKNAQNSQSNTTPINDQDISLECRKAVNVEKPECVKWFNELSNPQSKITGSSQTVSYDPANPYDSSIQQTITYEVTAKPVFSGCTKFNGKYIAYTQQGTKLEVTRNECKRLIDHGDRPFNYFQKEQQIEQVKQDSSASEQSVQANQQPETVPQVDAQVKTEQIPLGTKPPQDITGANSL